MLAEQATSADEQIYQLSRDLALAETKLRQREEALIVLNRRLLNLERANAGGDRDLPGPSGLIVAERDALAAQNRTLADQNQLLTEQLKVLVEQHERLVDHHRLLGEQHEVLVEDRRVLAEELEQIRKTKLFRYAAPFRRIYAMTMRGL